MRKGIMMILGAIMLVVLMLPVLFDSKFNSASLGADHECSEAAKPIAKEDEAVMKEIYHAQNYENIKAMWLSQFDLSAVYSTNRKQRAQQEYRILLAQMLDRVVETGINTIIVQVRPYMDSMYPSEFYPMSKYVVGEYGEEAVYDPFAILIEEAHERGLAVHAWINPLRGMLTEEIEPIGEKFPVKRFYRDADTKGTVLVEHDGRWYLNPAYETARELIVSGAREILMNYPVDGLHMDDYFYPSGCTEAFDAQAYAAYTAEYEDIPLMAFRRACVNALVRELYAMVKETNASVLFGISPGGNMNTNYHYLGADVYTWCSEVGYIDYICPQVYWGMEHETYDFIKVCKTFDDMISADGIKLIIGMTVSKAKTGYDQYAGTGQWEWRDNKDILYRCLQYTNTLKHCVGVSYFCYQYFYDPQTGNSVAETEAERALLVPLLKEMDWSKPDGG